MPKQSLNTTENSGLDPKDKELFLKAWDLEDGEMTDEQILMALKTGYFQKGVSLTAKL